MRALRILKDKKDYGAIKLNIIAILYMTIMLITPCYTYYMAVYKQKSAKPFPHSTITQTATKYPQNIIFRFVMGVGASLILLIFHTIYRWIDLQAMKSGFEKMSQVYYYLMFIGVICYCVAVETIDSLSTGPLHTPSAVLFFLILQIFIIYVTTFLIRLHEWDTAIISARSLFLKKILAFYVTVVWIYCLYESLKQGQNDVDYSVVLEWNSFFISLMWILSFTEEWKKIKLVLIKDI